MEGPIEINKNHITDNCSINIYHRIMWNTKINKITYLGSVWLLSAFILRLHRISTLKFVPIKNIWSKNKIGSGYVTFHLKELHKQPEETLHWKHVRASESANKFVHKCTLEKSNSN